MPLTPADVHNVVFKKPPIGKRGYDDDEVDAFLDEVERELVRLIEENNELKAQAEHTGAPGAPVTAGDGDVRRLGAENAELKAQLDRMHQENQRAEQAIAQAQQAAASGGTGNSENTGEQQALRVLMLAQRTADDHVADARRDADQLLAEARANAEDLSREAHSKAEALELDARQRHQEVMGDLSEKREELQKHIEQLKAFEREYRTRLKAYLESQLRELGTQAQGLEPEANGRQSSSNNGLSSSYSGSSFGLPDNSDARSSRK